MKRTLAIIGFILLPLHAMTASAQMTKATAAPTPTDLSIELVDLDPPSGSTLFANEPITVKFRYKYSRPTVDLRVWAKILDETYDPQYQGSIDAMTPGTGVLTRFVFLQKPGTVKKITLVSKDSEHRQIYARDFDVNYKFVRNPQAEALKNDGAGSRIVNIQFDPSSPARLRAGSTVKVILEYDINTEHGLDMSVEPVTSCNMTYSGMTGAQFGKGRIRKTFAVGEACVIKKVKVLLINAAGNHVVEKIVDVDLQFVR